LNQYERCNSENSEPYFDKKINIFQGICGTISKHLKKTHTLKHIYYDIYIYITVVSLRLSSQPIGSLSSSSRPFCPSFRQYRVLEGSSHARFDHSNQPSFFFTVCRIFLCSLTLCITSSLTTRSVHLIFCSITLRNFPGISYLVSEVSSFQHHTKLCS